MLTTPITRRGAIQLLACGAGSVLASAQSSAQTIIMVGLTPVFLNNDLELLTNLKTYLSRATGVEVQLVQRRTYEEITALVLSGQLDAAWICGYPYVQYKKDLSVLSVPLWRGKPLYRSYLIAPAGRGAKGIADLRDDIHAFSDPNSNSGYLVTAALLAEQRLRPSQFFRQTFFTYGHRNVVRAVASGLAQSGSVDGYVWEVMAALEPDLTRQTEIVHQSEELGFPPIACLKSRQAEPAVTALHQSLLDMGHDADGQRVLKMLQLDGFSDQPEALYDAIEAKMTLVKSLGP